jgi:hypothetical protein
MAEMAQLIEPVAPHCDATPEPLCATQEPPTISFKIRWSGRGVYRDGYFGICPGEWLHQRLRAGGRSR